MLLAVAVVPGLLSGCAPGASSTPSPDENLPIIAAAVEKVPTVTGSLVSIATTGTSAHSIRVKLYVNDTSSLAMTVDAAIEAIWVASPVGPAAISISAVDGPKPEDPSMSSPDGVELLPVAQELGFDTSNLYLDVLLVDATALADRYGAWTPPDGN